jgi:hypothetical protein
MSEALPPDSARLSAQLKAIAERCRTADVTVGELTQTLKGSPYLILMALLSLPFLTPIPMMGLSTPIGFLFVLFGLRLTFGQKPHVPRCLRTMRLPRNFFPALLKAASSFLRAIETFSRPRWGVFFRAGFLYHLYGLMILIMALLLLPPLPIPYTNFFPALTLVLLSLALMERDGLLLLLGIGVFILTLVFFGFLAWGGHQAWKAAGTHLLGVIGLGNL